MSDGINVLSLFDGISCDKIALEISEDLDGCCFNTSCMYDFDKEEG